MCDVLVVDDNELVLNTLVSLLEEEGWDVAAAGTPEAALRCVAAPPGCKVLVTDLDLGHPKNGFAVAGEARERLPDLQVVYVSGRHWLLRERTLDAHEHALPKPFEAHMLTSMVRAAMVAAG